MVLEALDLNSESEPLRSMWLREYLANEPKMQ